MRVTLYEENHVYLHENGKRYNSASSVIEKYKHPFDTEAIAINYAAKHGKTPEYWKKKWKETADFACDRGTAFHNTKELFLMNSAFYLNDKGTHMVHNWKQLRSTRSDYTYSDLPPGVYTELTLCNHELGIAGTADKVIIYEDGTFDIEDYKTNKQFKYVGFKGRMMKFPLHNLPDAHIGHYSFQLNLYAWMLAQYGLVPRKLRIHHYAIREEDNDAVFAGHAVPHIKPTTITVAYNGRLVKKTLEHYSGLKLTA